MATLQRRFCFVSVLTCDECHTDYDDFDPEGHAVSTQPEYQQTDGQKS